jgi:hypothetical protein
MSSPIMDYCKTILRVIFYTVNDRPIHTQNTKNPDTIKRSDQ